MRNLDWAYFWTAFWMEMPWPMWVLTIALSVYLAVKIADVLVSLWKRR